MMAVDEITRQAELMAGKSRFFPKTTRQAEKAARV